MRNLIIIVFFSLCGAVSTFAQIRSSLSKESTTVGIKVENGDTVYYMNIQEVVVRGRRKFKSAAEERQFWRLVNNVKKVYPYARLASERLYEMNEQYLQISSEKERKEYSKKVEEQLMAEFEGELRNLTITQGRILMRLVDRETGQTTYEIVKDFRGSVQAVFWQTVARVFGSNLKTNFDPTKGEDKIIEQIINEIEAGWL